jgi:D-3-phosphoglycerate dehydrogenase
MPASESMEVLISDLLEWLGPERRDYHDALEAWRTSCPRLPVWEEASNRGFMTRGYDAGRPFVCVTPLGMRFLRARRLTSECS